MSFYDSTMTLKGVTGPYKKYRFGVRQSFPIQETLTKKRTKIKKFKQLQLQFINYGRRKPKAVLITNMLRPEMVNFSSEPTRNVMVQLNRN